MSNLSPMDVFDNPITTEGYLSSEWGLPGEDPDESFADEGRVGEVAGPNYLLEESQAGVTEQVRQSLNEEDSAFGGYDSAFGGYGELLGAVGPTVLEPAPWHPSAPSPPVHQISGTTPDGWRRHFTAPKVAIGLLGLSVLGTLAVMVSDHDEP